MRSRFLAFVAMLLVFGLASTASWAQDQSSSGSSAPPGESAPAQSTDTAAPAKDGKQPKPAIEPADPEKVKHDGGKNDVEAVGNRNVGCNRGMGNWYSVEKQIAMGKQYAQQVESTAKLIQDPVVTEYVNRIGQNLVRNSDSQVPFTIKVIDADDINAFALPGGFFYVNSGVILNADEEAEMAGVMAHEIAHVAACHIARQMTRGNLAQLATIPLIFMGGWAGYGIYQGAGLAVPVAFMKFNRGYEAEADYLGVQYMYKAGYDPQAYVNFFEKVQAQEKKKPGTMAKVFADHPQTPDRIEKSQQEIAQILPARPQYVVSTSEFDEVKARLAAIENRHKIQDDKDNGKKPSLRRASTTDKNGKDSKGDDDDHPTLKRRPDSDGPPSN
jgi:beta-barrel assembly-enhancing protease